MNIHFDLLISRNKKIEDKIAIAILAAITLLNIYISESIDMQRENANKKLNGDMIQLPSVRRVLNKANANTER